MNTFLKKNNPLLIGITGGIGSGKTIVSKIITAFGYKVFNSDVEAKNIVNHHLIVRNEIINLLGEEVYNINGYNAKKVSEIVFNNPNLLKELNKIVHPRVKESFLNWIKFNKNENILFKESAILIETGAYKELDELILVVSEESLRLKRIENRDHSKDDEIKKRIKAQLTDKEKMRYSNFVIHNNEQKLLIPQIENFLNKFS